MQCKPNKLLLLLLLVLLTIIHILLTVLMQKEEKFLNMIMEFIPETLWSVAQCDGTNKPLLEALYVKVFPAHNNCHYYYSLLVLGNILVCFLKILGIRETKLIVGGSKLRSYLSPFMDQSSPTSRDRSLQCLSLFF